VLSRRGLRVPERLLVESLPARSPWLPPLRLDNGGASLSSRGRLGVAHEGLTTLHLDAYVAAKVPGPVLALEPGGPAT